MMHFSLEIVFQIVCLLVSISVYFQPRAESYLKLFPIYLFVGFTVEVIGEYLGRRHMTNAMMYIIFAVVEFIFYFWILHQIIQSKKAKKIIINILWIYPLLTLVNIFIIRKAQGFDSISYALGCFLIVAMCIFYFYELFQFSSATKLSREPSFWICTAVMFNYCCIFPIFSFIAFLHNPPVFIARNLEMIRSIINIFTYLLFIIAFLCRIKINKSMLQS